jgi:DNA topoisomerase-1
VNQHCPKCDSTYVLEVVKPAGTYLVCPNNLESLPKRRPKKGAAPAEEQTHAPCSFEKKIADPVPVVEPIRPDPAKTRPLVESVA